jgi:hypothetical protein
MQHAAAAAAAANHSREARRHPVLPPLHGMPEINHLQVHLFAQSHAGVRVHTAGFVGPHDLAQYGAAEFRISPMPYTSMHCNKTFTLIQRLIVTNLVDVRSISSFRGGQLRKITRVFSDKLWARKSTVKISTLLGIH